MVHVVRNGVDVALSLVQREAKARLRPFRKLRQVGHMLWPRRWPEFRADVFRSHRDAFHLWTSYLEFLESILDELSPDRMLEIRYEDLTARPAEVLISMSRFLERPPHPSKLQRAIGLVSVARRNAYLHSSMGRELYLEQCRQPLMVKFGYGDDARLVEGS